MRRELLLAVVLLGGCGDASPGKSGHSGTSAGTGGGSGGNAGGAVSGGGAEGAASTGGNGTGAATTGGGGGNSTGSGASSTSGSGGGRIDLCEGVTCASPPPSSCSGAVVTTYAAIGACDSGSCSYPSSQTTCPNGCANGLCVTNGWTKATSNTTQHLYAVWGSSASNVLAVGAQGTAVRFNGAFWQVVASGTTGPITSVHGTSASNIFTTAITNACKVMRFDGQQWSERASLTLVGPAAVFVIGEDDAFVYKSTESISYAETELYRVKNGQAQLLATSNIGLLLTGAGVWAFGENDVWVTGQEVSRWDGTQLAPVTAAAPWASSLWGLSPEFVFAGGNSNPSLYGSSQQWSLANTGAVGKTTSFSGTSPTRVFTSIANHVPSPSAGSVLRYDGFGWTQEVLPPDIRALNGIWAAPSGEVFAVGETGHIVVGP